MEESSIKSISYTPLSPNLDDEITIIHDEEEDKKRDPIDDPVAVYL